MLTSSVSPVIMMDDHPRERSLGTRPAPAVGRVFFLPAQMVSFPPKPVTARALSPLTASEQFQSHLFRLLTSSVCPVTMMDDHAREGSLATRPAPVAGRVFFCRRCTSPAKRPQTLHPSPITVPTSAVTCNLRWRNRLSLRPRTIWRHRYQIRRCGAVAANSIHAPLVSTRAAPSATTVSSSLVS